MLKTARDGQVWLITQPAHAELAGKMAAHWGNEEFAAPGHFAASADPQRLRREVVWPWPNTTTAGGSGRQTLRCPRKTDFRRI